MAPNSAQLKMQSEFAASEDKTLSFLLFSLGGELYGTPLSSTREVIRQGNIKPAPYMVPYCRGVINLRGQIISVIDLRIKFEIEPQPRAQNLIIIVESARGVLGAVVDDLVSVEKVQEDAIDQTAQIQTRFPTDFFLGVAKVADRLVNMVDIAAILSADELKALAPAA